MSIADEIEKLISVTPQSSGQIMPRSIQLERLEEVEKVLSKLGVSLEPKFEMSLNSRYGLYHNQVK